jgi:hypothetical protein
MSTQAETIMSGPKGLWTKTARFIEAMENASGPMDSYGMSRCFSQTHPTSSQTGHGISSFLATAAWLSAVIDCDDPAFEDTEAMLENTAPEQGRLPVLPRLFPGDEVVAKPHLASSSARSDRRDWPTQSRHGSRSLDS